MFQCLFLFLLHILMFGASTTINSKLIFGESFVGIRDAEIKEVPWLVSVEWHGYHLCSGTIISENYIVTAAHCTDGFNNASEFRIRAGTSTLHTGGIVIHIANITQHPQFDPNTIDYDIAILKLIDPLEFSTTINAVGLPIEDEELETGEKINVTGWDNTPSTQLQIVELVVISCEECMNDYQGIVICDTMICAGATEEDENECLSLRDSGTPFYQNEILYGIMSWGCVRPQYPGVYAKVAKLRSFITEVTGL